MVSLVENTMRLHVEGLSGANVTSLPDSVLAKRIAMVMHVKRHIALTMVSLAIWNVQDMASVMRCLESVHVIPQKRMVQGLMLLGPAWDAVSIIVLRIATSIRVEGSAMLTTVLVCVVVNTTRKAT